MIDAVELDFADGSCLVVESDVFQPRERFELGYLIFTSTPLQESEIGDRFIESFEVPNAFRLPLGIESLTSVDAQNDSIRSESGVALKYAKGADLIIAAAAFPITITIRADYLTETFDPECDIESCRRHSLWSVK
jgi:hypothetical protein